MARAKRVSVKSGKVFKTLTEAKAYFRDLRERTELESLIAEPDRSDVLDIYQR